MSALAAEHKAINLGQGFPDFPMHEGLVDAVATAMKEGHNQYVHMNGCLPLREAIAEKVDYLYGVSIHPDSEITVTPGGTYALYTALTTILQPGDEVIVFEPAYDSYIPAIELNGAKAVTLSLEFPGYQINWEKVKAAVNEKTRAIVINSPHNPTGTVLEEADMAALSEIVRNTNMIIISDEVYEHLIFDGKQHLSVLKYPELRERSFVTFSFGKVYHCTGWKLGYCIAPEALMSEFRKIHQFNCFTCDTPKQVGIAQFMKDRSHYEELGTFLQGKRDYFKRLMKATKFRPLPSHGSYFQVYDYSALSNAPEKEYAQQLTREAGVATIPVAAFYSKGENHQVLRFCFAKKESTLEAAVERLMKIM